MFARSWQILESSLPRLLRRRDLAALSAVVLVLLTAATVASPALSPPGWGLRYYLLFSLLMAFNVSLRLASDSCGESTDGSFELLSLTGLTAGEWTRVRILQMTTVFCRYWILRIPFAFFLQTRGVSTSQLCRIELLLLMAATTLCSIGLWASYRTATREQLKTQVFGLLFLGEILLQAPHRTFQLLSQLTGWRPAGEWGLIASELATVGLGARLFQASSGPLEFEELLRTGLVAGVMSLICLVGFWRNLRWNFQHAAERAPVERSSTKVRQRHRPRRSWDDALAWQAFCVHNRGSAWVSAKLVMYVAVASFGVWLGQLHNAGAEPLVVLLVTVMLLSTLVTVSQCNSILQREINQRTIASLLLTPHDITEICHGWMRGVRRMLWPDVVILALVSAGGLLPGNVPMLAPALALYAGGALLTSGPFLMLSVLVPMTPRGLATGVGVVSIGLGVAGVPMTFLGSSFPFATPLVGLPLLLLYQGYIQRKMLPYWLQQKLRSAAGGL